jgi:hypothetical protein
METWADQQLAQLRRVHPGWDIWYVPRLYQSTVWCARREGEQIATVEAEDPELLEFALLDSV